MLDAVCTGAVFVSLLEQKRVERLQILFRNLMNEDFGAGSLEQVKRQFVGCVRLGCQILNIAEVGLDLGLHAEAVRGDGGLKGRELDGKLLLASVNGFPDCSFVPRGGWVRSQGFPRSFAVTLGALMVGSLWVVFEYSLYNAPEGTESGLAIKDGWAI